MLDPLVSCFLKCVDDILAFPDFAQELSEGLKNTVLVDKVTHDLRDKNDLIAILERHIGINVIQV